MTTRRSNIRNFILWAELQRLSKERLRECEQATLRSLFDLFQTGNFEVPLAVQPLTRPSAVALLPGGAPGSASRLSVVGARACTPFEMRTVNEHASCISL